MIQVQEYDTVWPAIFNTEKQHILNKAGKWIEKIEHVGSTSVPGLAAKPTIDICIGVKSLQVADESIIALLQSLDYDYLAYLEKGIPERRYLQKLDETGIHLIHLHLVIINHPLWNDYILFRDHLKAHPTDLKTYEALKLGLRDKFANDRVSYTDGKAQFITNILSKAKEMVGNK